MNRERCFRRIVEYIDTQPIINRLAGVPVLWRGITARQEYPGTAHKDTETIFIRGPRPDTRDVFNDVEAIDYPIFASALAPQIQFLVERCLNELGNVREIGRVMIVNLHRHGYVEAHVDEGAYADHYDRFHLALHALEGNRFNVGPHQFEPLTGELWWFNHKLTHSVVNLSDDDRWHLIIDAVAPRYRAIRDAA